MCVGLLAPGASKSSLTGKTITLPLSQVNGQGGFNRPLSNAQSTNMVVSEISFLFGPTISLISGRLSTSGCHWNASTQLKLSDSLYLRLSFAIRMWTHSACLAANQAHVSQTASQILTMLDHPPKTQLQVMRKIQQSLRQTLRQIFNERERT